MHARGGCDLLGARRAPSNISNADGFAGASGSELRTGDLARAVAEVSDPNKGSCRMPFTDGRPRLRRCGRQAAAAPLPSAARDEMPDAPAPAESGSGAWGLLRTPTAGIVPAVAGSAGEAACAGVATSGKLPFAAPISPPSCAWSSPSESRAGSSNMDDIAAQGGRRSAVYAGPVSFVGLTPAGSKFASLEGANMGA